VKIAVFVNTPAQVHFYKNIVAALEGDGNQVFVLARDYGETIDLLNELDIPFFLFSSQPDLKCGHNTSLPHDVVNAFRYLKGKKIDLTTGWGTIRPSLRVCSRFPISRLMTASARSTPRVTRCSNSRISLLMFL